MTDEQKQKYNKYMRKYMLSRRDKERAKKLCPDCGIRHVEYDCIYCSECAQVRIDLSNDISTQKRYSKILERNKRIYRERKQANNK